MKYRTLVCAALAAALLFGTMPAASAEDETALPEETALTETDLPEDPASGDPVPGDPPSGDPAPEDPTPFPTEPVVFSDTEGHWAEDAIRRFSEALIVVGEDGRFRPDDPLTRAEMAVILCRVMRYETVSDELFDDLTEDWYTPAVQKLRAAGVMRGDENNRALPNDTITREEAVVMIARAFALADSEEPAPLEYPDADRISDWTYGSVEAMTAHGFLHGSDGGCFFPADPLTRAEAVTVLNNMITAFMYAPGEYDFRPYEGLADYVVIASNDVTVLNFDIGGTIFLSESVDYDTIRLKGVSHTGIVLQYTPEGYIRRLKASTRIVPINPELPTCSHDSSLFRLDERGIMHYDDPDVTTYLGVDVSSWQYEIDWTLLKAQGVHFAFIRAGYRGYESGDIVADKYFDINMQGALDAGIHVGVYFFSQAIDAEEAEEEARFTLEMIRDYNVTYPVVFDWETLNYPTARTNDIATEKLCEATNAFCATVASAGYLPMVYSNQSVSLLYYELGRIQEYDFWYAEYRDHPTFYYDYDIWQYGSSAHLEGVPLAEIDVNISFVDYAAPRP